MQIKQDLGGRMEQTYYFVKNNYKLTLGYLTINIGIYIISMALITYWIANFVYIPSFYTESSNIRIIIEFLTYMFVITLIGIGIHIGTIHYIKEGFEEKEPSLMDSFQYGMNKILVSFITYYYAFVYVYLIPLSLTIIGLTLILVEQMGRGKTGLIGGIIFVISIILLITFIIYRGNRAIFALYSAIDKDEFNKDNFEKSINITNENVLRIIGNMLIVGIIIGIIGSIINSTGRLFDSNSLNTPGLDIYNINYQEIINILEQSFRVSISGIIGLITGAAMYIFNTTFSYLFYKRLEYESGTIIELDRTNMINEPNNKIEL